MNLILRNARLSDGSVADIGMTEGKIVALAPQLELRAEEELDARGRLTLPALVNGQLHACKTFWRRHLDELPAELRALPRFEAAHFVKRRYTEDDVFARVDEAMRLALVNGTCAIRLFADVDEDSGLTALKGLLRVREKWSRWMTVQVVTFPQDGIVGERTASLMREAMSLGADVVGGIPFIEASDSAKQRHAEMCFALAREFDRDVHFVCDDTSDPASRTLEDVASRTIAHGWQGRVCATQCASLAFQDDDYAARVIALVKGAGITVFCNSHVSLVTSDVQREPRPRNMTRAREMLDAGVAVACAQDDIDNWFYAFGRNDLLEVAQFMAHMGQFAWNGEVDRVLPMVTSTPARALGLRDYGLRVGAAANLVVLDAADWHAAVQFQADKLFVIARGEVAVRAHREITLAASLAT